MSLEKVLNLTADQKPKIMDRKDARRGRLISRIEGQLALIDAIKGMIGLIRKKITSID